MLCRVSRETATVSIPDGHRTARIADSARPGQSIELEYEVVGDGPPLVWLHGLSGSVQESRPLCTLLADRFTVLSYSTRGHGRSTPIHDRDRYTYDVIAADLDAMLDHVAFDRPVIAGGSHGANTVLKHETLFPGRASGLLLVAPGANALRRPKRPHWWLIRSQLLLAQRRGGTDGIVKAITGQDVFDADHDEVAVAAARTHDMTSLMAAMRFIADQKVVDVADLSRFTTPSIVAAWNHDPLIHPIAVAHQIAAAIPGARFEEIDKLAGMRALESAAVAAPLIARWAAELSA